MFYEIPGPYRKATQNSPYGHFAYYRVSINPRRLRGRLRNAKYRKEAQSIIPKGQNSQFPVKNKIPRAFIDNQWFNTEKLPISPHSLVRIPHENPVRTTENLCEFFALYYRVSINRRARKVPQRGAKYYTEGSKFPISCKNKITHAFIDNQWINVGKLPKNSPFLPIYWSEFLLASS